MASMPVRLTLVAIAVTSALLGFLMVLVAGTHRQTSAAAEAGLRLSQDFGDTEQLRASQLQRFRYAFRHTRCASRIEELARYASELEDSAGSDYAKNIAVGMCMNEADANGVATRDGGPTFH